MSKSLYLAASFLSATNAYPRTHVVDYWNDYAERWQDDDLFRYVTRPELKPPKWTIVQHKKGQTDTGYLFVGPYNGLERPATSSTWLAHQTGPAIFDENGELIWSGANMFPVRQIFDVKVAKFEGSDHIAFSVGWGAPAGVSTGGKRVILNSSYQVVANVSTGEAFQADQHEFTPLDDGRIGVAIERYGVQADQSTGDQSVWNGSVSANSVHEFDMRTGKTVFEWQGHKHIRLEESSLPVPEDKEKGVWDYTHMNSADRLDNGDYLLSARHTNTIYLVSRQTGKIRWRLGGKRSSFQHVDGFRFARQHDARVRSQNSTVTIISFLNNAGDADVDVDHIDENESVMSLLMEVALYTSEKPMYAKVIRSISRPDKGLTVARGNFQYLPNGNVLGGWSDNAYTTEHTPSGEVVYEASFQSTRFAVYRTYKFPWVGHPVEPPVSKAFASATRRGVLTTVLYVSWNGATEVTEWCFYSADNGVHDVQKLGCTPRDGFETAFVARGHHSITFAEGVDVDGRSLGNSTLVTTELPLGWHDQTFDSDSAENALTVEAVATLGGSGSRMALLLLAAIVVLLYCCRHALRHRVSRALFRRRKQNDAKLVRGVGVARTEGVASSVSASKVAWRSTHGS